MALKLDSTFALAYLNDINFKIKANDFTGALKDCNKYLSIYPSSFDGYLDRSVIYLNINKPLDASYSAENAVALSPNDGRGYFNLGITKLMLHDTIGCLNNMKKSYQLGYNDAGKYISNYAVLR